VTQRFEAYHWQVLSVPDGNDLVAIEDAINTAKADTTRPTLIRVRTVIGYGSPKAGTNKVHGEAMGVDAVKATKKNLGWPEDKTFMFRRRRARTGTRRSRRARRRTRSGTRISRSTSGRIRSRRRSSSG
jgi:transketolase